MLSVVIATNESERALVPTLAALVPGATAGLVREVIITDPGSRDATAEVADFAGCRMLVSAAPLTERLAEAVEVARASWILFLAAGAVPQAGWIEEASRFIEEASQAGNSGTIAAVFRAVSPSVARASPLREAIALLLQALGLARGASHGLLIDRDVYRRIGGHAAGAPQVEADVIGDIVRRLGRRRVVTLRCGAVGALS